VSRLISTPITTAMYRGPAMLSIRLVIWANGRTGMMSP
jgi:hypothetical protein